MTTDVAIDPRIEESRRINDFIEQAMAALPPTETVPVEVSRAAREEGKGLFPAPVRLDDVATDRVIEGRDGNDIGLRLFVPPTVTGALLHIHGGGWVFGRNWMQDQLLWDLAQRANVAVASVEYRLAPEDPYPAGPDDCEDAALWLVRHAPSEFGTSRVLVGGESAGGHLSAVTALRLRDRHGIRLAGAILTFGAFDLSWTPSVRSWGDRKLSLTTPVIEWFGDLFLPGMDMEARRDPDISPLFANLEGLCPAIFSVGTADPLLDDTLFMEARWRAAGNETELHVYPEAAHGYVAFPGGFAGESLAAMAAFAAAAGT